MMKKHYNHHHHTSIQHTVTNPNWIHFSYSQIIHSRKPLFSEWVPDIVVHRHYGPNKAPRTYKHTIPYEIAPIKYIVYFLCVCLYSARAALEQKQEWMCVCAGTRNGEWAQAIESAEAPNKKRP